MKRFIRVRLIGAALLFSLLALWGAVGQAQVDTIDPNPTLPLDVGGSLTNRGFSDDGFRLGRTSPRDPNPAETLLKSMDGTNYGQATGHSLFSRNATARATSNDVRRRLSFDPRRANIDLSRTGSDRDRVFERAQGNAERQRNDPTQALEGRRAAARSASPRTARHVAIGTPQAPRITGKKVPRTSAK